MFCGKCGAVLDEDARFCPKCGTPSMSVETARTPESHNGRLIKTTALVIIGAIAAVVLLWVLIAGAKDSPEKSVKNYLDIMHDFDDKAAIEKTIGNEIFDIRNIEDASDGDVDIEKIVRKNCGNVKYKIVSCEETKDEAVVKVQLKYKDCNGVFNDLGDSMLDQLDNLMSLSEEEIDKEICKIVFNCYTKFDYAKADEAEKTIDLIVYKKDGEWNIARKPGDINDLICIYFFGMTERDYNDAMENL